MADDNNNGRKTRSLGIVPVTKLAAIKEFKQYLEASAKFAEAKTHSHIAKTKVKELLKKKIPALKDVPNFEFYTLPGGKEINVVEKLANETRRSRNSELEWE